MISTAKYLWVIAVLSSCLLNGCAGNIGAALPLTAALSSCSTAANAEHMVPENPVLLTSGVKYRISGVSVVGPTKSAIPPPIMAATFGRALERTLQQTGLFEVDTQQHDRGYILVADIISQTRHGTFRATTLQLSVSYSLVSQADANKRLWIGTITTSGEINDWKTDACARLRQLQERVSRQNIQQLLNELIEHD